MRRSDGAIAVGIGECISREGFSPESVTKPGDKCILYTNHSATTGSWKRDEMAVCGPEQCTWGDLGVHYKMAYEFPMEHKLRDDIIQDGREIGI